jgi:hypothetical protein
MNALPDIDFIQKYASQFATKCCDDFFSSHSVVDGKILLSLAKVKQVNFFAVKAIYEKWQEEAKKFESPYFDYTTHEIKQPLSDLLNLLSKNIRIKRDHYQPLLQRAVADTLIFTVNPVGYLESFLRQTILLNPTPAQVTDFKKYFTIHLRLIEKFFGRISSQPNQPIDTAALVAELQQWAVQMPQLLDTPEVILAACSDVIPVKLEHLLLKAQEPEEKELLTFGGATKATPTAPPAPEPASNFFNDGFDFDDFGGPKPAPEPESTIFQAREVQTTPPEKPETLEEKPFSPSSLGFDETLKAADFTEVVPSTQQETPPTPPQETYTPTSPKPFGYGQQPANDNGDKPVKKPLFTTDPQEEREETPGYESLLNKLGKAKVKQLKGNIPLNLKFKIQSDLFKGDNNAFNEAIEALDRCNTYEEAMVVTKQYRDRYSWDVSEDITVEFLNLVTDKF